MQNISKIRGYMFWVSEVKCQILQHSYLHYLFYFMTVISARLLAFQCLLFVSLALLIADLQH